MLGHLCDEGNDDLAILCRFYRTIDYLCKAEGTLVRTFRSHRSA